MTDEVIDRKTVEEILGIVLSSARYTMQPMHETHQNALTEWLTSFKRQHRLHLFFRPDELKDLISEIFQDPMRADFMLGWSIRVAMLLSLRDYGVQRIQNWIANGQGYFIKSGEISLIPDPIRNSLSVTPNDVQQVLEENFWLLVLFLFILAEE